jgi:hypothetical protein
MCPMFNNGICQIPGIEPGYVECINKNCCYKNSEYEHCRLYIVEYLINHKSFLRAAALSRRAKTYLQPPSGPRNVSGVLSFLSQKFHPALIIL